MNAIDQITAALAAPKTHAVLTTYDNGEVLRHEVRSAAAAENWAIGERRKLGKALIDRSTDATRRAVSVEIVAL